MKASSCHVTSRQCHKIMQQQPYQLRSSNISGSRKLSKDHSSERLFCRGVPVRRSLLEALKAFKVLMSLQLRFLMRCPSSTTRYFHSWSWKYLRSLRHISNEVTNTGMLSTSLLPALGLFRREERCLRRSRSLSSWLPWYKTTGSCSRSREGGGRGGREGREGCVICFTDLFTPEHSHVYQCSTQHSHILYAKTP